MIHTIQCPKDEFKTIIDDKKRYTLQRNDRDFREGDLVAINETTEKDGKEIYTGTAALAFVRHVCRDDPNIPKGYACLSIERMNFAHDDKYKLCVKADPRSTGNHTVQMVQTVSRDD